MYELQPAVIQCPYCWEQIEILVDGSVDSQESVEDCSVCCRPIIITAHAWEGELSGVDMRSEDDLVCLRPSPQSRNRFTRSP